jgi:transcriptional regulator
MYRPSAFVEDGVARLHAFIDEYPFATMVAVFEGRAQLAYVPVVLDRDGRAGRLRFHLAQANPVSKIEIGAECCFSFRGPDHYVSPDWYQSPGLVPTWNYMAVEARGRVERLDSQGLEQLLVDLSARQEAQLAPKKPWTLDKVPADRVTKLLHAIEGFALTIHSLEGKFKLSQDKAAEDRQRVVEELGRLKDGSAAATAQAMRKA